MLRRILPLLLLLALVCAASASGDLGHQKASIDAKIARLHDRIAAARAHESALSGQIKSVTSQIRVLESRVSDVSGKLDVLQQDLALHQQRLDKLDALFRVQSARFEDLKREYKLALDRLYTRMVSLYKQGQPTTVEIVLDAKSVNDLLDQISYFKSVAKQDQKIAADVRAAKNEVRLERARTKVLRTHVAGEMRSVQVREQQVSLVRDQLLAVHHKLSSARAEKLHALQATQDSEQEFVSEADALAKASAAITAKILAAQSSSTHYTGDPSASGLIWPVSGPVTSPFGERWGRMHDGIDIGVPEGTPIHAAAAGRVIYCGWEEGYGNFTVIDHGGGIATAYAHQSQIAVSCGQDVAQGQVIGYSGNTGHSTGPHLHFEVRVNGSAVDPMGYL